MNTLKTPILRRQQENAVFGFKHLIYGVFAALSEGKTVLMIAHRLTSLTNADHILVLENGRIAERGTHNELLIQNGLYLKMWKEYQQSVRWTLRKEVDHA
jgi:ATP-binding cassette subfamily B protein